MKVTLLGCGTSVGVPSIGRLGWGKCDPNDARNRRQRCAVLVETDGATILVDAGPDIRNQLLPIMPARLDAVLITHTHADHVAGIDDLRVYYFPDRIELPVMASAEHKPHILDRFPYLFTANPDSPSYFIPPMRFEEIRAGSRIKIGDCEIDIFHQYHGNTNSLGFLFDGKFGYSTDVVRLEDDVFDLLQDVPLWIVEALRAKPHQAHSHYEQTFEWIKRVNPGRAVLTHLGLEADYETLAGLCPANTEPGVDGMTFEL